MKTMPPAIPAAPPEPREDVGGRWRSALLSLGKCPACKSSFRDACTTTPKQRGCALCAPARLLLMAAEITAPPSEDTGRGFAARIEASTCRRCNGHGEHGVKERPEDPTRVVKCHVCAGRGAPSPSEGERHG